jgi:hypothetical protein
MRGDDIQQDSMFSYLSPEARVPKDHPLRPLGQMVNQAFRELSPDFQAMYSREGRPSIPPEKLLRAFAPPGVVYHPQRTTVDGAVGLQSPVSLVCGPLHGRQGLGPFGLLQESRALSRLGPGGGLFRARQRASSPSRTAVGRAFHCGRHSHRGLGLLEEFPPQGRPAPTLSFQKAAKLEIQFFVQEFC